MCIKERDFIGIVQQFFDFLEPLRAVMFSEDRMRCVVNSNYCFFRVAGQGQGLTCEIDVY